LKGTLTKSIVQLDNVVEFGNTVFKIDVCW